MADNVYVLDLCVTGADAVSFFDDGTGNDTLRVNGVYSAVIDIHLAWTVVDGVPINTFGRYVSADNRGHQLIINGQIENAFGSNGSELITGTELDNTLGGDQRRIGAGRADTLQGGAGDDRIYGGAGDDSVEGEADNDALFGDAGNDALWAGDGTDTVLGGSGADRMDGGGDAGDTLCYLGSNFGIWVTLTANGITTGRGGDAEGDQISGFTNLIGSGRKDRIAMADKRDLLSGLADNTVYAGGGDDRVAMGGGQDTVLGGNGNDDIYGETGDDSLSGEDGNDHLVGGFGRDMLSGGAGADRFEFLTTGDSTLLTYDVITDFSAAEGDRIDLRAIDGNAGVIGNQRFHLISGDFTGIAGEVRVRDLGRDLIVSGDRNGDMVADFAFRLVSVNGLVAGDFFL